VQFSEVGTAPARFASARRLWNFWRRYLSASLVENHRVGTLRSVFFRFGGLRGVKTIINRFHLLTYCPHQKKASRKTCFFLSKSQTWHIITTQSWISSRISVYLPAT